MNRHHRIRLLLVLAICLLASISLAAETFHGKVVGISDGDTIKVLHEGTQVKIRLYGIDTPEKRQAFGSKAKQFTSDQVFGKTVKVVPMDTDRYGRTVALVQSPDAAGTLNEALVQQGFAWVYRKYCKAFSALTGLPTNKPPIPLAVGCGLIQILFHRGNTGNGSETSGDTLMAHALDPSEILEFKELLMASTIQIDAMYQLLIQKGYFTEAEFLAKMKVVPAEYQKAGNA